VDAKLVIDAIVKQTTVLIAQLASGAGVRTPLADLANQTFLSLVRELERQGIGQKVIADMFGLALRSYQQKVQRLSESATDRGLTLWEAVHAHIQQRQVVTRTEVLKRFSRDDDASVRSILNDLVDSGLVFKAGRGDAAVLRAASADEMARADVQDAQSAAEALAWVAIYREGPMTLTRLREEVRLPEDVLDRALAALLTSGRVREEPSGGERSFVSDTCLIPLGERAGWEAALLDHYHAVVRAMCAKLGQGQTGARADDRIGGSTYAFDVWQGHPSAPRVYALLAEHRKQVSALWEEVTAHNAAHPVPENHDRVTFYFGQNVTAEGTIRDASQDD
jgi:hypothetical protein